MSMTHYHHRAVALMTLAKSAEIATSEYLTSVEHTHPIGHIEAFSSAAERFTEYPTIDRVLQKDEAMDDTYHDAALQIWEGLQSHLTQYSAHAIVPGYLDRLAMLILGYAIATLARDLSKESKKHGVDQSFINALQSCHKSCKRYVNVEAKLIDEVLGSYAPDKGLLKSYATQLIDDTKNLITVTP